MANQGIAPPDFTTDVGKVRLLIQDTDASSISGGQGTYLWQSDDEITALLEMQGGPGRVAIFILRQVAMSPAMQLKKWSSADLSVDGPAITRALRDLINDLEKNLDNEDGLIASEFAALVNVGAGISQPYFFPGATGVDLDPTLPARVI